MSWRQRHSAWWYPFSDGPLAGWLIVAALVLALLDVVLIAFIMLR